jgi:hypothetical protein
MRNGEGGLQEGRKNRVSLNPDYIIRNEIAPPKKYELRGPQVCHNAMGPKR